MKVKQSINLRGMQSSNLTRFVCQPAKMNRTGNHILTGFVMLSMFVRTVFFFIHK